MAYTYNIPQANDQLSASQPQILANFTSLGAIAGNASAGSSSLNNTVGFNFTNFAPQGADPAVAANRIYLYNKVDADTGINQLFVGNPANTPGGTVVPFTAGSNGVFGGQVGGWTYFASGYLLKWGVNSGSGNVVVNLNSIGPAYTVTPLMFQLTPQGAASVVYIVSSASNTFTYNSSVNTSVYWMVLGY